MKALALTRCQVFKGLLLLALGFSAQACWHWEIRNVIALPEIENTNVFPLSVRVEVREFDFQNASVLFWTKESFRKALFSYIQRRGTFREIVDGPSDLVLTIDAKYKGQLSSTIASTFSITGRLTVGERIQSSDSQGLGSYTGTGKSKLKYTKPPLVESMNLALDSLFQKIERDREIILAKVGMGTTPVVAATVPGSMAPTAPVIPASDVDRIPAMKATSKKNAYAVVIGIENYREKLPKADFADRDAKLMGEYLTKVLGYPEENVVVRLNERATRTDLVKYFEEWLRNNVDPGGSVFVYYSGHGAPNVKTGEAYLVPYDGDPAFVDSTAYPVKQLYAALEKLPAKEIVVVMDSCFSGAGGRSVIAKGLRPMVVSVENPIIATGKTVVLAASSGDQISSTYEEKGHGLLTYYFLKGLQGEGDLNKDGAIEMAELFEYMKPNVQRVARKQYNNEQTPQLLASPDLLRKGGGRLVELR